MLVVIAAVAEEIHFRRLKRKGIDDPGLRAAKREANWVPLRVEAVMLCPPKLAHGKPVVQSPEAR